MNTITIDGIKFNLVKADPKHDPCAFCDVAVLCKSVTTAGDKIYRYLSMCRADEPVYLKRVADNSASEYDNREELARKLDIARTALALIYGGVKVCRTIDEIKAMCAQTLEETK